MGERADLTTLKPWLAEPDADGAWQVTAPGKYRLDRRQTVAYRMAESDARAIALVHPALDLLLDYVQGEPEAHGEICKNDPCRTCYARNLLTRAGKL